MEFFCKEAVTHLKTFTNKGCKIAARKLSFFWQINPLLFIYQQVNFAFSLLLLALLSLY